MSILKSAQSSLTRCKNTLQQFYYEAADATPINQEELKQRMNYFDWIYLKTGFVNNEKIFAIPNNAIPGKINAFIYKYLHKDKRITVDKYYRVNSAGDYFLSTKKSSVPQSDVDTLIHSLVLRRGHVIWVHFGFNVGNEFGGKHPALILKNMKNVLSVLPLSTQTPSQLAINIEIDKVYGFPLIMRWGNITRIVPISIQRIDFNNIIGSVRNNVLKEVDEKLKKHLKL